MKIGIYYNSMQVPRDTAEKLARRISDLGGQVSVFCEPEAMKETERVIVLGGDGTVLRAARLASAYRIPIVGVNFGHLGFLTEFDGDEIERAADLVLSRNCPTIERSMLEVDINGTKTFCLNELSILRSVAPDSDNKSVKITVVIDGSRAGDFNADGLIVCTPTGSTAYSLSAGGSIMTPNCGTFQITPVCAFSLKSRPIAYPDSSELKFLLPKDRKLVLSGDGIFLGEAGERDRIAVRKADRTATFLTKDKSEYFRRLTEKIN